MNIQKRTKRILTILLCGALLFGIVPNAATADELSSPKESTELSTVSETSEVVSLREENIKHFDMGDGTYQAIVYGHPVHELDADGNWQDIDFSLSLTETRGNQKYVNQTAGVAFAEKYEAGKPVMSLSKDGNAIDMSLLSTSTGSVAQRAYSTPVAAAVKNPESEIKTIEEANQAVFSSSILYEDVAPGVDLEYIVDPGLIKENIVVKEPSNTYRYVFTLNLIGMYPVLQDNGSIYLFDSQTDEKTYIIPAPYMYDAVGYESEAVEYTLLGSGNTYSLAVTADASWINAEDRSFPVTIDPSFYEHQTQLALDTYTDSENPTKTHSERTALWIRSTRTTYIKTPTPNLPQHANLCWAYLTAFYYYYPNVKVGSTGISAHRILEDWDDETLCWSDAQDMAGDNGLDVEELDTQESHGYLGAIATKPLQIDFDITEAVELWLDDSDTNYGIGLKFDPDSTNRSVVIKSIEAGTYYRPRINYKYSMGFEFIHYYDDTIEEEWIRLIPNAFLIASKVFKRQFNISLYMDTPVIRRNDLTSACSFVDEDEGTCECTGQHHKDIVTISDKLYEEVASDRERIVFWTDWPETTYCTHETGGHLCLDTDISGGAKLAVVHGHRPVIHVLNLLPDGNDSDIALACMTIVLIHEIAHTFGLEEQDGSIAGQECDSLLPGGGQCVMGDYPSETDTLISFYNILKNDGNGFCNSCEDRLAGLMREAHIIPVEKEDES